jgi:hypothetical protein
LGAVSAPRCQPQGDILSDIVGGLDFKTYQTTSTKTNIFDFVQYTVNAQGLPNPPIHSTVISPTPLTYHEVNYLPLSFNYHGNWRASANNFDWGLGISANPWYSGSLSNLQSVTGSTKSTGHWVILTPRFSWQFPIYTNWLTTLRADGQWASEPLISNEQFGAGGVNSVRGYREGEVFGDTGWHVTLEQETPPHIVGWSTAIPLIVRGSVYMDYADTYLLDPQGRPDGVALWGTGFGFVTSDWFPLGNPLSIFRATLEHHHHRGLPAIFQFLTNRTILMNCRKCISMLNSYKRPSMITNLSIGSPRNVSIVTLSWLICQCGGLSADANPGVGTVSQGSASFNTSGSQETITTSGQHVH